MADPELLRAPTLSALGALIRQAEEDEDDAPFESPEERTCAYRAQMLSAAKEAFVAAYCTEPENQDRYSREAYLYIQAARAQVHLPQYEEVSYRTPPQGDE